MTTYFEAARALPVPGAEQTRAFAEFVTGAHSWYKHLPILPLSPFVFYLDPNAGRSMVHVSDDQVQFVDNVEGQRRLHYTWQTTDSYRRRFGHWNYDAPCGTSLMYASDMGVVDTAGSGLNVADVDSTCWLEIPQPLTEAGTALVSSLMYLEHWLAEMGSPRSDEFAEYRIRLIEPFWGLPPDSREDGAAIGVMRQLIALRATEDFLRERAEIECARRALFAAGESSGKSWDDVYGSNAFKATEATWERSVSRQREKAMIATLALALNAERTRQVQGMQAAMRCFVEALHADGSGTT